MIRRLLALLAICAGLAAAAEPARASVNAVESVRLVEQAALVCGYSQPVRFAQGASGALKGGGGGNICLRPVVTIVVPTVMLQEDRAHE